MTPLVAYALLFVAVGVGFIFVHLVAGKLIRPRRPGAEKGTIYECGEPTIGSAWVQFDLRFYVVALLFVIFDVEVAFFFPWAEVFGKANAVAAMGQPTDPAGYQLMAERAKQLVPPHAEGDRAWSPRYGRLTGFTPERAADLQKLRQKQNDPGQAAAFTQEEASIIVSAMGRAGGLPSLWQVGWVAETMIRAQEDKEKLAELTALESQAQEAARGIREEAQQLAWLAFIEIVVFFGVLLVGFAYLWRRGDLAWVRSTAAERPAAAPPPVPAAPVPPAPAPAGGVLAGAGSGP
jgi:NADH:ubiquinone oxidoreductase subunit 3 (subunit A)